MKNIGLSLLFFLLAPLSQVMAQDYADTTDHKVYVVIKNDGSKFVGRILKQDAREVLMETEKVGQVAIPKHEIREIKEVQAGQLTRSGEYVGEEVFSTRYFITTNGLPVEKGESYILWNLYGPDFQFSVAKNLTVGVMTTWVASPIVGSAKYSFELGNDLHLGVGTLLGTLSWARPDWGLALPYGSLTIGDRRANATFSGGMAAVFGNGNSEGRGLFSIAAMTKVSPKLSLVFDSFILPFRNNSSFGSLMLFFPGLRIQTESNRAFQFAFGAISVDGELLPAPIPMVQWFRKL